MLKKRITLSETDTHANDRETIYQVPEDTFLTALELLRLYIRKRRFIVLTVLAVVFMVAVIAFLLPNQYRSTASLLPSGEQDKMAELKSLAGLGSLTSADENSSELFPTILRSQTIQDQVLSRRYNFGYKGKPISLTLEDYFDQDNPDKLRQALGDITTAGMDKKTGVIGLSVETTYPQLSQQIVKAYIEELESFNLYKRRSQGKENASYLAKQMDQTMTDLTRSEDSLESYQMANRNWTEGSSPDMLKEIARLQREVEIQNKKYLYLTEQYEMAKLDALRDVPIVRVLDEPTLPVLKSSPKRLVLIAAAAFTTLLLVLFGLAVQEVLRRRWYGHDASQLEQFRDELADAFPALRKTSSKTIEVSEPEQVIS